MLLTRLCLQIAQLSLSYHYHHSHQQHSLKKEIKVQGLLMMKEVVVIFQHQYREILELHQLAHLLLTKIAYPQSKYLRTPADQFHQVCKEFNCNIYLARSANRDNCKHLMFFPIYFYKESALPMISCLVCQEVVIQHSVRQGLEC